MSTTMYLFTASIYRRGYESPLTRQYAVTAATIGTAYKRAMAMATKPYAKRYNWSDPVKIMLEHNGLVEVQS